MAPAAASYNYSQDVTPSHESTRLPPISSLLERPETFSAESNKSRSNGRDEARHYPPHSDSSARRSPFEHRRNEPQSNASSRHQSSPSDERHRDRSSYRPSLPMPSGTPVSHDRQSNGWSERAGPSRSPYDYQGPGQSHASPYGGPPNGSGPGGSNLPPPPPYQNGQPAGYRPGAYGPESSYGPGYGAPPPGHSPTYPPSGYSNGAYPPPHHRPDLPSPYHESPPGAYPRDHGPGGMQMYDSMEDRPTRRRRGNLPKWATDYLKQWFFDHIAHPYPTEQEKQELCKITGLGMTQLSNWFINARRRQNPVLHAQAQAENMIRDGSSQASSEHAQS